MRSFSVTVAAVEQKQGQSDGRAVGVASAAWIYCFLRCLYEYPDEGVLEVVRNMDLGLKKLGITDVELKD